MNVVGQPISRADGRLKVTGAARYTADIALAGAVRTHHDRADLHHVRPASQPDGAACDDSGLG